MREEAFLKTYGFFVLGGLGLHEYGSDRLEYIGEWGQYAEDRETEDRVDESQGHRVDDHVQERVVEHLIADIKEGCAYHDAHERRNQVTHGSSFAVRAGAERGKKDRNGGADRDTHEEWKRRTERHDAGEGEGLDDTDGGRGGLQDRGEYETDEDTEKRESHRGEHVREPGLIAEAGDGAAHGAHADHEDGETEKDVTDVAALLVLAEHSKEDAGHGDDAREGRGREDAADALGAADVT